MSIETNDPPKDFEVGYDIILETIQLGFVEAYTAMESEETGVCVLTAAEEKWLYDSAKITFDAFLERIKSA